MPIYKSLNTPEANLKQLISDQNDAGAEFAQFEGDEPLEVLVAKAIYNLASTGGALGEVSSVNGKSGTVTLTPDDIGLSAVNNVSAAALRDRTTHTGAQAASTVTGLPAAIALIDDKLDISDFTAENIKDNLEGLTGDDRLSITAIKDVPTGFGGDVTGVANALDGEVALFSGITGKAIKRASATGIAVVTAGVLSAIAKPTGDVVGTSATQTISNKTHVSPILSGTITGVYTLGGTPSATTQPTSTNDTTLATTAFVKAAGAAMTGIPQASVTNLVADLAAKQPASTILTNTTASFTSVQQTKLAGIATGATANLSDATLLGRANHTGTQAQSTVTNLVSDLAALAAAIEEGGGTTVTDEDSDSITLEFTSGSIAAEDSDSITINF